MSDNHQEYAFVLLHLNARLQPMHRGAIFEELFDRVLRKNDIGEVTGGGTFQDKNGEIISCDVEMDMERDALDKFLAFLHRIDLIPKGSWVHADDGEKLPVGTAEGLALYLNGTDLSVEVYQNSDINELIAQLEEALKGVGQRLSHWEGSRETALYFYGASCPQMAEKIAPILERWPLCQ